MNGGVINKTRDRNSLYPTREREREKERESGLFMHERDDHSSDAGWHRKQQLDI